MRHLLPRGAAWHEAILELADAPGFEEETFEQLEHELDRAWSLGEFERREPLAKILQLLAGWAQRWEEAGTPLYPRLVALWDPVQSSLRNLLFDLFPGEYTILSTLPGPRFLTLQSGSAQSAIVLFHRPSTFVAAAFLNPQQEDHPKRQTADEPLPDHANPVLQIITEMTGHLPKDWEPAEIRAFLTGGHGTDSHDPHRRFEMTLLAHGVAREDISSEFANRTTGPNGALQLVFDRTTGRLATFHPGFSSVDLNLRSRDAQNRSVTGRSRIEPDPEYIPLRRAE